MTGEEDVVIKQGARAGPSAAEPATGTMARFHVNGTFEIASRKLFVVAGSIVEGTVRKGMSVEIPLRSGLCMTVPIAAVEFVLREGGREEVALCFHIEDEGERAVLAGLDLGGEEVVIREWPR